MSFRLPACFLLMVVFGVAVYKTYLDSRYHALTQSLRQDLRVYTAQVNERAREESAKLEAQSRAFLSDPEVVSGRLAESRRDEEWRKRASYDGQFAVTSAEKALIRMMGISEDATRAPEGRIKEVAALASPWVTTIGLYPGTDGFLVVLNLDMSPGDFRDSRIWIAHTKESLKRHVEEVASRVVKDIFGFCGQHGIGRVRVLFRHSVTHTPFPGHSGVGWPSGIDRVEKEVIYQCSMTKGKAPVITNWRSTPTYRFAEMLEIEYDGISGLKILPSWWRAPLAWIYG